VIWWWWWFVGVGVGSVVMGACLLIQPRREEWVGGGGVEGGGRDTGCMTNAGTERARWGAVQGALYTPTTHTPTPTKSHRERDKGDTQSKNINRQTHKDKRHPHTNRFFGESSCRRGLDATPRHAHPPHQNTLKTHSKQEGMKRPAPMVAFTLFFSAFVALWSQARSSSCCWRSASSGSRA
jgi:hypothetical protein